MLDEVGQGGQPKPGADALAQPPGGHEHQTTNALRAAKQQHLRDAAAERLKAVGAVVMGEGAPRLPNTLCVAAPGIASDLQLMALDLASGAMRVLAEDARADIVETWLDPLTSKPLLANSFACSW